jgi:hypothetical protein
MRRKWVGVIAIVAAVGLVACLGFFMSGPSREYAFVAHGEEVLHRQSVAKHTGSPRPWLDAVYNIREDYDKLVGKALAELRDKDYRLTRNGRNGLTMFTDLKTLGMIQIWRDTTCLSAKSGNTVNAKRTPGCVMVKISMPTDRRSPWSEFLALFGR